jgi:hypothetical protein
VFVQVLGIQAQVDVAQFPINIDHAAHYLQHNKAKIVRLCGDGFNIWFCSPCRPQQTVAQAMALPGSPPELHT